MRTLGIIGGTSWVSTQEYYRGLNTGVQAALGGTHSAPLVVTSVDFQPYAELMAAGDWDGALEGMKGEARRLARAGVDGIAIASNTFHVCAEEIEAAAGVPLVHIADAAAARIKAGGHTRIGLMGTRYSMEKGFYTTRLRERHAIESLVPGADERARINAIIFDELCREKFVDSSRAYLLRVVDDLAARGAQCVVLGCTELPLVVKQEDVALPVIDTLDAHVAACLDFILERPRG
ncbi:MAG TPA: amino acid racemase [Spirochaetia bacterium]